MPLVKREIECSVKNAICNVCEGSPIQQRTVTANVYVVIVNGFNRKPIGLYIFKYESTVRHNVCEFSRIEQNYDCAIQCVR